MGNLQEPQKKMAFFLYFLALYCYCIDPGFARFCFALSCSFKENGEAQAGLELILLPIQCSSLFLPPPEDN